jgi:serine/threonine-protein kinase
MSTPRSSSSESLRDYTLLEQIGRGPLCSVWRCRRGDGPELALKQLDPRYQDDVARIERFEAEARLAQSLIHPHIVRVHEVVGREESPLPFFVMDLLTGGAISQFRGLELDRLPHLRQLLAGVCDALEHIHQRGLVHCDVKPSNILLDGQGQPFLTDFGMAASAEQLAREGATGGTVVYMAPEQMESITQHGPASRPFDGRADVYALGVLLYELTTGEPPFKASNRFALLYQRSKTIPKAPSVVRPGLPADLDSLVLRALAGDPAGRFASAAEMAAALRAG